MSLFNIGLTLALIFSSAQAATTCQPEKWRELSNEKKVIASKSFIQRKQGELTIQTPDGRKKVWKDEQSEGAFSLHRVIEVDPKANWVLLFEPSFDGQSLSLFHRKSGASESLDGCVIWSSDRRYFATVSEDGGSGRTPNEVSVWGCPQPAEKCERLWKKAFGGQSAKWSGKEVVFSGEDLDDPAPGPHKIRCKISTEHSTDSVRCAP